MPLNIDWQQILLHLFNFTVLFAILYFLLYNPVKQFMDKRTEYYKKMDDDAKANLADAEKIKAEYTEKLAAADDEISAKKEKARKDLEIANATKKKQAENEAAKIISDARNNAEKEHDRILKEAQGEIKEMVTSAAEKLVSGKTTSEAFDEFLTVAQGGKDDE